MNNEQEYKKQLRRIKQFIKRAEKRGFVFDENIIPETPARITTRSVNKLQNIKPKDLYKKSTYKSPTTGVIVKGQEGRTQERKESAKKAAETRAKRLAKTRAKFYKGRTDMGTGTGATRTAETLSNVREQIAQWTPSVNWSKNLATVKRNDVNILKRILDGAISEFGEDAVARRLDNHSVEINTLLQEILYASGGREEIFKDGRTQVNADLARFASILKGHALNIDESISISEQVEYYEVIEE